MQAPGKKRLWYRCFSMSFTKFLKASFPIEHLRWLLLNLHSRKEDRKRQKKELTNKPQEKKCMSEVHKNKFVQTIFIDPNP